jgi:hypothetical protein
MSANEQHSCDPATGTNGLPGGEPGPGDLSPAGGKSPAVPPDKDPGPDRSPAALRSVADLEEYPEEMTENEMLVGPIRDCVWIGGDRNTRASPGIPLHIHTGLPEDGSGRYVAQADGRRTGPVWVIVARGDSICHVWGFRKAPRGPRAGGGKSDV